MMDERSYLQLDDLKGMLDFLIRDPSPEVKRRPLTPRKAGLFVVSLFRDLEFLPSHHAELVTDLWLGIEGMGALPTKDRIPDCQPFSHLKWAYYRLVQGPFGRIHYWLLPTAQECAWMASGGQDLRRVLLLEDYARRLHALLGNPFEEILLPPGWKDHAGGLLPRMARLIHEEEDWESLPALADALEEAGCQQASILAHLRGQVPCPVCGKRGLVEGEGRGHYGATQTLRRCPRCRGHKTFCPPRLPGDWVVDALLEKT